MVVCRFGGVGRQLVYIVCGLMFHLQDMEEQFATEDVIDAEHGDEEEDVEMDFGEETGGSEGTSATEEDDDPDEEGDPEEDGQDGQVDPDVDVDGVWEVRRMCLFRGNVTYTTGL